MQVKDFIVLKLEEAIEEENKIFNEEKIKHEKQKTHYSPMILNSLKKGFVCSFIVEFVVFMFVLYLFSMLIVAPISLFVLKAVNIEVILFYSSILFIIMSIISFCIPEETTINESLLNQKAKIEMANKTLEEIKKGDCINNLIELRQLFFNKIATNKDLEIASKYIKEEDFVSLLFKNNNKIELFDLINKLVKNDINKEEK